MEVEFEDIDSSDLYVDCEYKGGPSSTMDSEPFHKLIPGCENAGGFRKKLREDGSGKYAYIILYTSMEELEWPDFLDEETGIFRYYGDNREPGREITDTKKKGNKILETTFALLNEGVSLSDIPPFLIFKKTGVGRNIRFLGLAAPGNPKISPDRDLVAFWRTYNGKRFQNYEAYFSILDTGEKPIPREWIKKPIYDHDNSLQMAPDAWKNFIKNGRNGIRPLCAPKIVKIPTKYEQLQSDEEGNRCLQMIRDHYKDNDYGFEACAKDVVLKMDSHFNDMTLTRPWRDGGRDAVGHYTIYSGLKVNNPLVMDCALEAKCYSKDNAVTVKSMSRLISRIRYRQFGILVTTSYVHSQAYKEVVEDGHPILIVTATDIANILRQNSIYSNELDGWLHNVDEKDERFTAYYDKLKDF